MIFRHQYRINGKLLLIYDNEINRKKEKINKTINKIDRNMKKIFKEIKIEFFSFSHFFIFY